MKIRLDCLYTVEFTLYNRRVCVYIYLDYQQQTSRSIIVQCDLEKKNRIHKCRKKTNELLTDDPKSGKNLYKNAVINLSTANYINALDFVHVV